GFPLCFRAALTGRTRLNRALGLAPTPILAAVVYLASSRGGVVTAIVAAGVFVATTARRWQAVGALLAAGLGSLIAIEVLLARTTLVNGPLDGQRAVAEGRSAAVLILGCCVLTAAALAAGERVLAGRTPAPRVGWAVIAALAVLVVTGTVLAH